MITHQYREAQTITAQLDVCPVLFLPSPPKNWLTRACTRDRDGWDRIASADG